MLLSTSQPSMILTQAQFDSFQNDGFVVIPNFIDSKMVELMKSRAAELVHNFRLEDHPVTTFFTHKDHPMSGKYFLDSSDKISFFYEKDALDSNGTLQVPKTLAFNKIGHGLHLQDETFRSVTLSKDTVAIIRQLGFIHPVNPGVGGEVMPHQDSTFLYTKPLSATGFWIALDHCNSANGTLAFVPGSHKHYPIERRMVRTNNDDGAIFEGPIQKYPTDGFVELDIEPGSLVLIHGSVVHKSGPNIGGPPRNAYTFHVIEGSYEYDKRNWLQPSLGKDAFDAIY